jgi:hypothetical protein
VLDDRYPFAPTSNNDTLDGTPEAKGDNNDNNKSLGITDYKV